MNRPIVKCMEPQDISQWRSLSKSYDKYARRLIDDLSVFYNGFEEYMASKVAKREAYMVCLDSLCCGVIAFSKRHNRITFFGIDEKVDFQVIGDYLLETALERLSPLSDITVNVFDSSQEIFRKQEMLLSEKGFVHNGEMTVEEGAAAKVYRKPSSMGTTQNCA